jgi:hypothetical protein
MNFFSIVWSVNSGQIMLLVFAIPEIIINVRGCQLFVVQ